MTREEIISAVITFGADRSKKLQLEPTTASNLDFHQGQLEEIKALNDFIAQLLVDADPN